MGKETQQKGDPGHNETSKINRDGANQNVKTSL